MEKATGVGPSSLGSRAGLGHGGCSLELVLTTAKRVLAVWAANPLLTSGEGRGSTCVSFSGSMLGPSGVVPQLPVLVEGRKAGFIKPAEGVVEPSGCS
jgi:hypothetical protein